MAGVELFCCPLDGWNQLRRQATVAELSWTLSEMRKRPSFDEFLHRAALEPGGSQSLGSTPTAYVWTNWNSGSALERQWAATCRIHADQRNSGYAVAVVQGGYSLASCTFGNDPPRRSGLPCSSTKDRPPCAWPAIVSPWQKSIRLDLVRTHLAVSPRSGHEP
jgi:hypothetical protein